MAFLRRQFRRYFSIASAKKGVTGETLLQLLEQRLDNTIYRMGFAESRQPGPPGGPPWDGAGQRQKSRYSFLYFESGGQDLPSGEVQGECDGEEVLGNASKSGVCPEWLEVDTAASREPSRKSRRRMKSLCPSRNSSSLNCIRNNPLIKGNQSLAGDYFRRRRHANR